MGTKLNPDRYDCYAKAEPDEPLFVLLARDKHAPTLVWLWSVLRELDREDPAVVQDARQCTVDMMDWAVRHGRKPVGIAQSVLAGVFELMRAANAAVKDAKNVPTNVDAVRVFLCESRFEGGPDSANFPSPAAGPGAAAATAGRGQPTSGGE